MNVLQITHCSLENLSVHFIFLPVSVAESPRIYRKKVDHLSYIRVHYVVHFHALKYLQTFIDPKLVLNN